MVGVVFTSMRCGVLRYFFTENDEARSCSSLVIKPVHSSWNENVSREAVSKTTLEETSRDGLGRKMIKSR